MDCSLPGLYWISQARILGWIAFPSPGHLPDSRIEPMSPALAGGFLIPESPAKPLGPFGMDQIHSWTSWIGPNIKCLLAWTRRLMDILDNTEQKCLLTLPGSYHLSCLFTLFLTVLKCSNILYNLLNWVGQKCLLGFFCKCYPKFFANPVFIVYC